MTKRIKDKCKEQSHKDCFLLFKNNIYLLMGMIVAAAICMYGILSIYGFSAFPDEFGYWSPAAAALGYDWSEITGLGSYYSYGYSALLFPILLIFHDSITAYRAAIILNLLLQCLSMVLLFLVMKELYPKEDRNTTAIVAVAGVLYPAWLYYTQTTFAEALLNFGLILSIYLMMRFLKKPRIATSIAIAVVLVYLYMVHMRCVGAIGAGALILIIRAMARRKEKEKKNAKSWILILLVIALFLATFILKDRIIRLLYHETSKDVLSWNDYSGIAFRIKKIISLQGIGYLLKDLCGKVLYMGLSTFGIAYFGIAGCVKRAYGALLKIRKRQASYIDFLWIYIVLMVVFQFMVALIYLNGASSPEADRLDNFLHGRYIDFFLPVLIATGLVELLNEKKVYLGMTCTLLCYLGLGCVAHYVISTNNTQMHNVHGFTMVGMSYFVDLLVRDTIAFFYQEVIILAILTLMVFTVVILARSTGQRVFLAFILIIQIVLGVEACDQFVFKNQEYIYGDVMMADRLKEITKEYPEKRVLHIYEGGAPYIELVQFGCRDTKIAAVNAEHEDIDISKYLDDSTILITCEEQDYEEILDDYYEEKWSLGHLRMYYSP